MKKIILIWALLWLPLGWSKSLQLYVDHATLPALQQLLHFTQHRHENHLFVFHFKRFTMPEKILNQFPDRAFFIPMENNKTQLSATLEALLKEHRQLELNIHINLYMSTVLMDEVLSFQKKHPAQVTIKRLYFYDDGLAEYNILEQLRDKDVAQLLQQAQEYLGDYLRDGVKRKGNVLNRYAFPAFYPSHYTFLRADYIQNEDFLQPLRDFLQAHGASHQGIDWNTFQHLDADSQAFYLTLMDFDDKVRALFDHKEKNYIFIGSNASAWKRNISSEELAALQVNMMRHMMEPQGQFYAGENYRFYFKGHPREKEGNALIMQSLGQKVQEIPAHIPFEVLNMAGIPFAHIGGMNSSLFVNSEPSKASYIFFTDKQGDSREALFDDALVRLFIKLNGLRPEQIQWLEELPPL